MLTRIYTQIHSHTCTQTHTFSPLSGQNTFPLTCTRIHAHAHACKQACPPPHTHTHTCESGDPRRTRRSCGYHMNSSRSESFRVALQGGGRVGPEYDDWHKSFRPSLLVRVSPSRVVRVASSESRRPSRVVRVAPVRAWRCACIGLSCLQI